MFGMFAANSDFTGEGQIIADKDSGSRHQTRRKRLIVGITQADDPTEVGLPAAALGDGKNTKVSSSFMTKRMSFLFDRKARRA
jgi:hypothetical protein